MSRSKATLPAPNAEQTYDGTNSFSGRNPDGTARRTTRTLDTAVCACGHWFDDHKVVAYDRTTGKITLGMCLDATCPCFRYGKT